MLSSEEIHARLSARWALGPLQPPRKDAFCVVGADCLIEVANFLKTDPALSFDFLQDLTATDHLAEQLIRIVYHFYSYRHHHIFILKVELPRATPTVESISKIWNAATWLEREVFDLFGVGFTGHPDLRRIMLPDDWIGHPLRKDYVEAGGYQGISNVRDNPLDLFLAADKARDGA